MNETQIKKQWAADRSIYAAWGEFVRDKVVGELVSRSLNPEVILKIPAKPRLKEEVSLIDKALYRAKEYSDPYNDIEDKVGVRFVVLLLNELRLIETVIEDGDDWTGTACRHFEAERLAKPLLFTYQSVHFILRPNRPTEYSGIMIPESTTCEVQIRTLLQHAHAELTHDAIYKAKKAVPANVERTVAKSIALIEATDGFFEEAVSELNAGPLKEHGILKRLDGLYKSLTGYDSHSQKSAFIIWDVYEDNIDETLVDKIQAYAKREPWAALIQDRYSDNAMCQQSTILFLYWMLRKRRRPLIEGWPLSPELLRVLALDLGVSLDL